MSALLKVYTDSGHTSEVAHTAKVSTTSTGSQAAGTTNWAVVSTANMDAIGVIDIIDNVNGNETIAYVAIADATHLTLAKATANSHSGGQVVNQWYYGVPIGDQTAGILNDGGQNVPTGLNTNTWYVYNAGDQTAISPAFSVSAASPATADGAADTLISVTNSGAGFSQSVTPANIVAGGVQQIWIAETIPLGQGNTPGAQIGVLSLQYQSV